ncbi:hypothetical protein EV175_005797, partial [Coemansia sp. RSA 1933]
MSQHDNSKRPNKRDHSSERNHGKRPRRQESGGESPLESGSETDILDSSVIMVSDGSSPPMPADSLVGQQRDMLALEHQLSTSSSVPGTLKTKIHGSAFRLGISSWAKFFQDGVALVDKSAAIVDVMDPGVAEVIAGMYPRRMGKTTFLDMLADFLGILRPMPREERE